MSQCISCSILPPVTILIENSAYKPSLTYSYAISTLYSTFGSCRIFQLPRCNCHNLVLTPVPHAPYCTIAVSHRELNAMSELEHTCRICRGEATTNQPLIHPCRCRGSIKYIHQECLMEWILHSNQNVKLCDICNTPYRFRTVYDPNMPKIMPLREVWNRLVALLGSWAVKNVLILFYTMCGIQIPLFWMFFGRVFTYAVDGKFPSPNVLHTLYYGAYTTRSRSGALLSGPDATFYDKLETVLVSTILSGTLYVIAFMVVLFILFIEHEWVVREEGYTKLLLRQIGKEPRTKLADLLSLLLEQPNGDLDEARQLMVNRALEDLHNMPDAQLNEHVLRRALENNEHGDFLRGTDNRVQMLHDDNNGPDAPAEFLNGEERDQQPIDGAEERAQNVEEPGANNGMPELDDDVSESEDETAEELERRRNIAEGELAAVEAANNNGDIFELLGLRYNLTTPIQLMLLVDFIMLLFLFNAYLIPHILGKFTAMLAMFVFFGVKGLATTYVVPGLQLAVAGSKVADLGDTLIETFPFIKTLGTLLSASLWVPFEEFASNLIVADRVTPPTVLERAILLSLGYAVICMSVHQFMNSLIAGGKPLRGTTRKIYKVLFQVVATAKVFTIFAIEIFFFPVFCGWLLDFCVTPLIATNFVTESDGNYSYVLLATSRNEWTRAPYVRSPIYWLWGTCYMFFVALFVGMIRNHILRPGVLYFIKSPEDPNARLIHDAVVKPFTLQILRIILSLKVYTVFVVLGIGSVTWGLRFIVNAPGSNGLLLPIQQTDTFGAALIFVTILLMIRVKSIIANYCRMFWKRSFINLCYKLRLSHFILGSPIPQERGRVVYRNMLFGILGIGQPDYSKPVSFSEATELFRTDSSVNACFVPDGNYIRAPGTDDNSRKFLREMFVPVTKSDQLIAPEQVAPTEDDETDWWDADIVYEDSYTVVFRPPNVRLRCFTLVCMICVFGALLMVVIGLGAIVLGRPIQRALMIICDYMSTFSGGKELPSSKYNWAFIDTYTLCFGLQVQILIILLIDHRPDANAALNIVGRQPLRFMRPLQTVWLVFLHTVLLTLTISIAGTCHHVYLTKIESHFFGTSLVKTSDPSIQFGFTWHGLLLHLMLVPWTVFPFWGNWHIFTLNDMESQRRLLLTRIVKAVGCFGFIMIHRLFLGLDKKRNDINISPTMNIYLHIATLLAIVLTSAAFSTYSVLTQIHEQIKNEKYVTGTAIESIEVSDDEA